MKKKTKLNFVLIINIGSIISGCIEEDLNAYSIVIEGKGSYSSIQSAIDNASDGDTILVYEGTYYESIVINKSISLIGEDNDKTIIDYNNKDSGDIILINADECISELEIQRLDVEAALTMM